MDVDPEARVGRRARIGARGERGGAANHRALMPAKGGSRQRWTNLGLRLRSDYQ
jgi:hypothetical protein